MRPNLYVENFRIFDEEGTEITLNPVTLLTGCNSAGKSSITKALLLLKSYLSAVKANNYDFANTPLDFSAIGKLGNFDSVLNNQAKKNGHDKIVLGYHYYSELLHEDCLIKFIFTQRGSDDLNYGWLSEIRYSLSDKELFIMDVKQSNTYDCSVIGAETLFKYCTTYLLSQYYYKLKWVFQSVKSSLKNKIENDLKEVKYQIEEKEGDKFIDEKNKSLDYEIFGLKKNDDFPFDFFEKNKNALKLGLLSWCDIHEEIFNFEKEHGKPTQVEQILPDITKLDEQTINFLFDYILSDKGIEEFILITGTESDKLKKYRENFIFHFSPNPYKHTFENFKKGDGIRTVFENFLAKFIKEPILTSISKMKLRYVDSTSVNVKRLYSLDTTDPFGLLCREYNNTDVNRVMFIDSESLNLNNNNKHIQDFCYDFKFETYDEENRCYEAEYWKGSFTRKWLRRLNICNNFIIENIDGFVQIKLVDDSGSSKLLADYGYGITQLITMLLNIEIEICNYFDVMTVTGSLNWHIPSPPKFIVFEEPEIHLHPNFQAMLADIFFDATTTFDGINIIAETHSEYLLRRTQVLVAQRKHNEKNIKSNPFRVYYFPIGKKPYDMGYQTNGKFIESFGTGFYDVADNAVLDLFEFDNN